MRCRTGEAIKGETKTDDEQTGRSKSSRISWIKDAGYTVEAAFILPLVFLLVFLIIEISFYCYDRTKLQAVLNDVTRRAAQYIAYDIRLETGIASGSPQSLFAAVIPAGESTTKEIESYCQERLKDCLIISDIDQIKAQASITQVKITVSMNTKLLFALWIPGIMEEGIHTSLIQSQNLFPREEKARIIEVVLSLGKKVKGVSEGIDQIKELLH